MKSELTKVAAVMVGRARGILAADESTGTITRRFDAVGIECTKETRRSWRNLLFSTTGIEQFVSGVIMFDETLRQHDDSGELFTKLLAKKGIIPGIKVDKSTHPLAKSSQEPITEGLDGLRSRLIEYRNLGAQFAKWRAVIKIGANMPSAYAIEVNSHALASYAALCQDEGLVPIVEPEVLMDGNHDIATCAKVTEQVLHKVFSDLLKQRVVLEEMVLKPNMLLSGKDATNRASAEEVASVTLSSFLRTIPAAVPGIAFLSGGQSDDEATVNLNSINQLAQANGAPWELTYSYGRGLQSTPLKIWSGQPDKVERARAAFLERCQVTSQAREGRYNSNG